MSPAPKGRSAGLLVWRIRKGAVEVLLAHPGGPFFVHKDDGHWTIPKGLLEGDEDERVAAKREFEEETGLSVVVDPATYIDLGEITQKGGKIVRAFACACDWPEPIAFTSNLFDLEWPPRSGRIQQFPEMDRGGFLTIDEARRKIKPAQEPFIDRLLAIIEDSDQG